ncbi:hypothetical protein Nepgr_002625 [Nepenthes gracilis]|uniref:Uncharacterized protein n=1 Tax=Nepenthes gracilis TaxID=150966 RepID=A0AAD3RYD6_NEPGR|nr:hypothetical protein Nepgr_002625 [Nepenthes gracilis]
MQAAHPGREQQLTIAAMSIAMEQHTPNLHPSEWEQIARLSNCILSLTKDDGSVSSCLEEVQQLFIDHFSKHLRTGRTNGPFPKE